MSNRRDPRWSKQFGDFGEQLVMYLIGRQKNMKVALVDHAGADLIASDLGNKENRYTKKRLPLWIWNVLGRLQWYIGSARQLEKRKDTLQRANKAIDLCESEKDDCVLVTHGFFMKTLIAVLKKRGYMLVGNNQLEIKNLQMIWAEK